MRALVEPRQMENLNYRPGTERNKVVPTSKENATPKEELRTMLADMNKSEMFETMKRVFASLYMLQAKVKRFRWNYSADWKGSYEITDSLKLEQHALDDELDLLAKRISEMGFTVPGALLKINDLSRLQQRTQIPKEHAVYHQLATDNRTLSEMLDFAIELAWNSSDYNTTKLLRMIKKNRDASAKALLEKMETEHASDVKTELTLSSLTAQYN